MVEVKFPKHAGILICVVYRPQFQTLNQWIPAFEQIIENAYMENKKPVIMGDFNIDVDKGMDVNATWKDVIDSFQLSQIVSQPTRVTHSTRNLLDHIYVSAPDNVRCVYYTFYEQ